MRDVWAMSLVVLLGSAGAVASGQAFPEPGAVLATVAIPRPVVANGEPLPAARYELRFTGEWLQALEEGRQQGMQWIEFVSNGRVAGRELALVIPAGDIGEISSWHPPAGATRVELLKTRDFLRIWANRGGTNYLIHLAVP